MEYEKSYLVEFENKVVDRRFIDALVKLINVELMEKKRFIKDGTRKYPKVDTISYYIGYQIEYHIGIRTTATSGEPLGEYVPLINVKPYSPTEELVNPLEPAHNKFDLQLTSSGELIVNDEFIEQVKAELEGK